MVPGRLPRLASCLLGAVALVALLLPACAGTGAGAGARSGDNRLQVVTTVAPLTNLAANVTGGRARVVGVVPEGTNSHTFDPPPRVAELLSGADLVFLNGLQLEEPTEKLARANRKDGGRIVKLGERTLRPDQYLYDFSFPEKEGKPNPHLWTDPTKARRYAEVIKEEVARADPQNAASYQRNYEAFSGVVDELDRAMRQSFATIPPERRKLLTYHDAYAYFARTYDWQVVGAIQVADFDEPSAREVAELIAQVRRERVPAIFGSEVFPSPVLERIGEETGVRYVDVLRDDDLPGRPGASEHSWVGLMRFDFVTMVKAVGGDASALEAVRPRNVAPDTAEYPQ